MAHGVRCNTRDYVLEPICPQVRADAGLWQVFAGSTIGSFGARWPGRRPPANGSFPRDRFEDYRSGPDVAVAALGSSKIRLPEPAWVSGARVFRRRYRLPRRRVTTHRVQGGGSGARVGPRGTSTGSTLAALWWREQFGRARSDDGPGGGVRHAIEGRRGCTSRTSGKPGGGLDLQKRSERAGTFIRGTGRPLGPSVGGGRNPGSPWEFVRGRRSLRTAAGGRRSK